MKNILIQLVNRMTLIEADKNFECNSARVLAYATIETDDGFLIKNISIRQDVANPTDIRVIFPFRKLNDELVPYITFNSPEIKKKVELAILESLEKSVSGYLDFRY